jgi:hypothetical protein
MNDYLKGLVTQKQEEIQKANQLTERYENGNITKEEYDKQMDGIENTYDILGKEIESEIEKQGLSEKEFQEACQELEQEKEQGRGR